MTTANVTKHVFTVNKIELAGRGGEPTVLTLVDTIEVFDSIPDMIWSTFTRPNAWAAGFAYANWLADDIWYSERAAERGETAHRTELAAWRGEQALAMWRWASKWFDIADIDQLVRKVGTQDDAAKDFAEWGDRAKELARVAKDLGIPQPDESFYADVRPKIAEILRREALDANRRRNDGEIIDPPAFMPASAALSALERADRAAERQAAWWFVRAQRSSTTRRRQLMADIELLEAERKALAEAIKALEDIARPNDVATDLTVDRGY